MAFLRRVKSERWHVGRAVDGNFCSWTQSVALIGAVIAAKVIVKHFKCLCSCTSELDLRLSLLSCVTNSIEKYSTTSPISKEHDEMMRQVRVNVSKCVHVAYPKHDQTRIRIEARNVKPLTLWRERSCNSPATLDLQWWLKDAKYQITT